MCADGWFLEKGEVADGVCPDCEMDTLDGIAIEGCNYSPVACETCRHCPCDDSC